MKLKLWAGAAGMAWCLLIQPVAAGQLEDAYSAALNGDDKTAFEKFKSLAEQGNEEAQFNVASMYASGQGVPQDYVQALLWFNVAAIGGNAMVFSNRDNTAERMTPDQIAEAQRLAREWLAAHPKP